MTSPGGKKVPRFPQEEVERLESQFRGEFRDRTRALEEEAQALVVQATEALETASNYGTVQAVFEVGISSEVNTRLPLATSELSAMRAEDADALSISAEAVRMRVRRGTLRSEHVEGTVYVLLDQPRLDQT
jgi:hypothetical protein